jgi:hypothetical protein
MTAEMQNELNNAIHSDTALEEIVTLLRRFRDTGSSRDEVESFLTVLYQRASNEEEQDRIAEVADFVAGFCSPHMKIWDDASPMKSAS